MRADFPAYLVAVAMAATPLAAAGAPPGADSRTIEGILANRTAGPTTDCIHEQDSTATDIVPGAIVYRMKDGTLMVNRPDNCPFLNRTRSIAEVTPGTRLCRGDLVQVFQPGSPVVFGSCALSGFTAYSALPRRR